MIKGEDIKMETMLPYDDLPSFMQDMIVRNRGQIPDCDILPSIRNISANETFIANVKDKNGKHATRVVNSTLHKEFAGKISNRSRDINNLLIQKNGVRNSMKGIHIVTIQETPSSEKIGEK